VETGVATPSNPLGLPSAQTCKNASRFAFRLHQPRNARIVRVDVYVNGRRVKTMRARKGATLRSVVLSGLPAGAFTLKVVATTDHHHRIVSQRRYHTCAKSRHHHRRRSHHRHDPDHDGDVDRPGQR
jgi:hypothetical protein